jgi:hypothetical protein
MTSPWKSTLAGVDPVGRRAGHGNVDPGLDQTQPRIPKLEIFVDVVHEHQNALAL